MLDSEVPEPAREETWITVLKDIALGAAAGLALAVFWLIIGVLSGSDGGGLWWSIKGCGLFVLVVALTASGAIAGFLMGETAGIFCGAAVGYFLPFIIFGAWIQRTIGWRASLRGSKKGGNPSQENKPDD